MEGQSGGVVRWCQGRTRSPLEVPVDGSLRLVKAERARAHRVFQVPSELGVGLGDFLDGTADSPRHSGSSPLGGAPQRPGPSAQPQRTREQLDDLIELLTGPFRPGEIVGGVGVVDLVLQFADARLNLAAGSLIELRRATGRLGRPVGQLEAMHLNPRSIEQPRQIAESLLVGELDGEPVEVQAPDGALAAKPRHVGLLGHGPRDGLGPTVIGILLEPRETETLLEAFDVLGPSKGIHVQ